jgi:hypothetical protein
MIQTAIPLISILLQASKAILEFTSQLNFKEFMKKNTDLSNLSFPDEEVISVKFNSESLEIMVTGYAIGAKKYEFPCRLVLENITEHKILRWDIESMTLVNYDHSLDSIREINDFENEKGDYRLKGFTQDSEWVEVSISAENGYLLTDSVCD